eukprot:gene3832-8390_t
MDCAARGADAAGLVAAASSARRDDAAVVVAAHDARSVVRCGSLTGAAGASAAGGGALRGLSRLPRGLSRLLRGLSRRAARCIQLPVSARSAARCASSDCLGLSCSWARSASMRISDARGL